MTPYRRLRGVTFLLSGLIAVGLIGYLWARPATFTGIHPYPLIVLLLLTMAIAAWQAWTNLR